MPNPLAKPFQITQETPLSHSFRQYLLEHNQARRLECVERLTTL